MSEHEQNGNHRVREIRANGEREITPELPRDAPEGNLGHKGNLAPEDGERGRYVQPQVWIGSLADYNAGILTGDWVDAATSADELETAARQIVAGSETQDAEEWAIFDYEGFGDWKIGEHEGFEVVSAVARGITEHGLAFAAWASIHDAEPDMLESFVDRYLGAYDSPKDWAETVMDDMGVPELLAAALPSQLQSYASIDTERWVRDAWLGGEVVIVNKPDGGVWVFAAGR